MLSYVIPPKEEKPKRNEHGEEHGGGDGHDDDNAINSSMEYKIDRQKQPQSQSQHRHHHHQIATIKTNNFSYNFKSKHPVNDNRLIESPDDYTNELKSYSSQSQSHSQSQLQNKQHVAVYNPTNIGSVASQLNDKFQVKSNNGINVKININVRTPSAAADTYNDPNNVCGVNEHDENSAYKIATSSSSSSSNCDVINSKYNANNMNAQQRNSNSNSNTNFNTNSNLPSNGRKMNVKKSKPAKLGTKTVGLKRVSFGSSKGSMVETLVFETPTPLSEHAEPNFSFADCATTETHVLDGLKVNDDSGIEIQEETGHSVVRVSIYQSNQPQQICPPSYYITTNSENLLNSSLDYTNYNYDNIMATATASSMAAYDRQQSTDSGWENPFRPGGDLSREADEIVKMISGGKPITPTDDHTLKNGSNVQKTNTSIITEATTAENVTKRNVSQSQATQNGANHNKTSTNFNGNVTKTADSNNQTYSSTAQISKQVVPGPTSASHVLIDEKKNKRKGCCIIQ